MATDFIVTGHAKVALVERDISEDWLWDTIAQPYNQWEGDVGNLHYARAIDAHARRVLHVVVNTYATPKRIVTVFFDRRLSRKEKL